jgi:hypothetical protein
VEERGGGGFRVEDRGGVAIVVEVPGTDETVAACEERVSLCSDRHEGG